MVKKIEKEYLTFANLGKGVCASLASLATVPSDADIAAFLRGRSLGLNPWGAGPSWDYRSKIMMPLGEGMWFARWENNAPPVSGEKVDFAEETPDLIRQEAQKMFLVIQLFGMFKECTDNNGLLRSDMILARRGEIDGLVDLMFCIFPDSFDAVYLDLAPDPPPLTCERVSGTKTVIRVPDFGLFFDNILSRVQLGVARDKDGVNPMRFNIRNGKLEIRESCLLTRLWYECISDLLAGKYPPRLCKLPTCLKLFSPKKPNAEYCCPEHQNVARARRQRRRAATEEGRVLRPGPGRPPAYGTTVMKRFAPQTIQNKNRQPLPPKG